MPAHVTPKAPQRNCRGGHVRQQVSARSRAGCCFFSSRRRHTRLQGDWSSDVCSSDLDCRGRLAAARLAELGRRSLAKPLGAAPRLPPPGAKRLGPPAARRLEREAAGDRKSTRLNSSHLVISYAVFCLKKKKNTQTRSAAFAPDHCLPAPSLATCCCSSAPPPHSPPHRASSRPARLSSLRYLR